MLVSASANKALLCLQMGIGQDSERKRVFNQIGGSGHISNSLALIASMRTSPGPLAKSADIRC